MASGNPRGGSGRRLDTDDAAPAHIDFVLPKPVDLAELNEIFDRPE